MDAEQLLRELLDALIQVDEYHVKNDTNSMIKKTHECIAKIKVYFGDIKDE
jgi:hypothetical protein